jgi:hypothetical protein
MEHTSPQQGSKTEQTSGFLAGLSFFDGILKWLVGLFRLTHKEQEDAGIYLGDQGYQ